MSEKKEESGQETRNLIKGMAIYSGASILGPLAIFGFIGYFLDRAYNGHNLILLFSIFIAFIITNILIFRKTFAIMAELKSYKGNGKNGYDEDEEE